MGLCAVLLCAADRVSESYTLPSKASAPSKVHNRKNVTFPTNPNFYPEDNIAELYFLQDNVRYNVCYVVLLLVSGFDNNNWKCLGLKIDTSQCKIQRSNWESLQTFYSAMRNTNICEWLVIVGCLNPCYKWFICTYIYYCKIVFITIKLCF